MAGFGETDRPVCRFRPDGRSLTAMTGPPTSPTTPAPTAPATEPTAPATQPRALRTRARILDATISCLIDDGYHATSTARVQDAAGVSRGALMHHFPSKQALLLEAVAHLAARRGQWLTARAAELSPTADRTAAVMGLLWSTMTGPLFAAATELWVAARTDDELREALVTSERRLGEGARQVIADLLGVPDPSAPDFRTALDLVLQLFRGASLTALLRDDARWERHVVATATALFTDTMTADAWSATDEEEPA